MRHKGKNHANFQAREHIADALLELSKNKPLSAVSISELTKQAGVSRMTFYRNYHSIEEVFAGRLEDILKNYQLEKKQMQISRCCYDRENLEHCFRYFRDYRDFLNGMFQCGFGTLFLEKLTACILENWEEENGGNRYELYAFAGALYNLAVHLTMQDGSGTEQEMIQTLCKIYQK